MKRVEEEGGSQPLPNQRWEDFCERVAGGMNLTRAYLSAADPGSVTLEAAKSGAHRLSRKPAVKARLAWLRRQATLSADDLPVLDVPGIEAAMGDLVVTLDAAHARGVGLAVSPTDLARARGVLSAVASRALKLRPATEPMRPEPTAVATPTMAPLPLCSCPGALP